ncbi:MAG: DinB family protein [Candidatus Acidiferrales bacterium]
MKSLVRSISLLSALAFLCCAGAVRAQDGKQSPKPKAPSQAVIENWNYIGDHLVTMAEDWPEDKYGYRLNADVRTFQQVLLHIAGSNYDLINRASGRKIGDGANDPNVETYKTKAQTVAFLKQSIADGVSEIKREGDAGVLQRLDEWINYTEHMGEHYGLLVAYYRANGIVPPTSRPAK